jgi:endonuclease/exonuclease/phosphatase family metal-dependent hydrolase
MDYKKKYLKYKKKYLELYNKIGGYIDDYNNITVDDYNNITVDDLKKNFIKYVTINKHNNDNISKPANVGVGITIGTYNIHYFTDVYEKKNTYSNIINDIEYMNLDILLLEEALIGSNIKINDNLSIDPSNFYEDMYKLGYKKVIVCNNVPSWFNGIYCNILLIHQRIMDISAVDTCKINYNICENLNEYIYSFDKAKETTIVSGKHAGTKETRCYIYITFTINKMNIHLYGTHLDVASETERLNQINQIIKNAKKFNSPNDYIIILGDFNTNDLNKKYNNNSKNDYVKNNKFTKNNNLVINRLKKNYYYDIFQNNLSHVEMTAWNNLIVDFIFVRNGKNKKIPKNFKSEIFYTDASDHLPIILHIDFTDPKIINT